MFDSRISNDNELVPAFVRAGLSAFLIKLSLNKAVEIGVNS